ATLAAGRGTGTAAVTANPASDPPSGQGGDSAAAASAAGRDGGTASAAGTAAAGAPVTRAVDRSTDASRARTVDRPTGGGSHADEFLVQPGTRGTCAATATRSVARCTEHAGLLARATGWRDGRHAILACRRL